MAIATCKECSKEISSKAELCPRCGFRRREGKGFRAFKSIIMIVIGSVMLVIAAALRQQGG